MLFRHIRSHGQLDLGCVFGQVSAESALSRAVWVCCGFRSAAFCDLAPGSKAWLAMTSPSARPALSHTARQSLPAGTLEGMPVTSSAPPPGCCHEPQLELEERQTGIWPSLVHSEVRFRTSLFFELCMLTTSAL